MAQTLAVGAVARWAVLAAAGSDAPSFAVAPFDAAMLTSAATAAASASSPLAARRPAEAAAAARLLRLLARAQLVPPPLHALDELLPLVPAATAVSLALDAVRLVLLFPPAPAALAPLPADAVLAPPSWRRRWDPAALDAAAAAFRAAVVLHPAVLGPLAARLLASA